MSLSSFLVTDELTILLGLIAASSFLLRNLYKPQPLVHPILLGRQSDVGRVRKAGESAVYRNYGTGMMGRFPLRPSKDVHVIADFVKPDFDAARTLWSTKITNAELTRRVAALGTGLVTTAGLNQDSNVLLLLNDGIEFILTDLALASHGIPSFTLTSLSLLSSVLESHPPSAIVTHASFVRQLLELIHDSAEGEHHTVIVVGETGDLAKLNKLAGTVNILRWEDVETAGVSATKIDAPAPDPSTVFTVSFFASPSGQLHATRLTHANLTAGVAATRALLPLAHAISPLDTIVSSHSLSTPFGRTVAYTALYEGTSFATTASSKLIGVSEGATSAAPDLADIAGVGAAFPIPSPTLLVVTPAHLAALSDAITVHAGSSPLYSFALRHKAAALAEGFLTKDGLWDRLVLDAARGAVLGDGAGSVRALVVAGAPAPAGSDARPLAAAALPPARIALSVPVVHTHAHAVAAGPLFAAHPLDLQAFPARAGAAQLDLDSVAHVGPPSVNVEARLVGVDDAAVEGGADPEGVLFVKGPSVGTVEVVGVEGVGADEEGWVPTGERAKVATNGCFRVLHAGL